MGTKKAEKINKYIWIFFLAVFSIFTFIVFSKSWSYEMNHAYNWDCPLYWTVGKGMINDIEPYSGLYENKPVGIFLISALSFALTDDTIICNLFSFLCLVVIALTPVLCIWTYCRQKNIIQNKPKTFMYMSLALIQGLFLMKYCEINSGSFQSECLGSAFVGLYFWTIMHINWKKGEKINKKPFIFWSILAGFFVMCSVMFKEPFILLIISGSLFMVDSVRDFVAKTVIPCCIGGILTIILLVACGVLPQYFSIYLKNMFGNHISVYGSPFQRMFRIDKLVTDMTEYSVIFALIIAASVIIFLLTLLCSKKKSLNTLWKIFVLLFALLSASFVVGLGGQYFHHHYAFAIPFYMILMISICKIIIDWSGSKNHNQFTIPNLFSINYNTLILPNLILLIFFFYNMDIKYYQSVDNLDEYEILSSEAQYVDDLLDYYNENTYQYLGFNNDHFFYGLTRHIPKGPAFVQDPYNFTDKNNWFCQSLLKQLDEVNIVIVQEYNISAVEDDVKNILNSEFTTEVNEPYTKTLPPEDFECEIYYRKSVFA